MEIGSHVHLIPKSFRENLRWRKRVLDKAATDIEYRESLRQLCSEDILFYINGFVWTYNPKNLVDGHSIIPMVTYPFQDDTLTDLVNCIGHEDYLIKKSRDMGASWMCLLAFEWFWHFKQALSFLVVSRVEDLVDKRGDPKSLFWKIDFSMSTR